MSVVSRSSSAPLRNFAVMQYFTLPALNVFRLV
jgi:hypothetical protein